MMLATGVDLTEIAPFSRLLERHGARFLDRIYSGREQEACAGRVGQLACLFAAKEAIAKVLGTGLNYMAAEGIDLRDMEIVTAGQRERTQVYLHGAARARAAALSLHIWSVSLASSRTCALALVVAMQGPAGNPDQEGA